MDVQYREGNYKGRILEQGFSKNDKGTPMFVVKFQPESYLPGDGNAPLFGARMVKLYITEKTIEQLTKKLRSLLRGDQNIDRFTELDPRARSFVNLIGNEAQFFCKYESSQQTGEPYEKWDVSWGESKPIEQNMTSADIAQLDALYSSALRGQSGVAGNQRAAARPAVMAGAPQSRGQRHDPNGSGEPPDFSAAYDGV